MLVEQVPYNSLSWGVGAVALLLVGCRLLRAYGRSNNYLSKYFGLFGLVMGASMAFTSLPTYFSSDVSVLRPYFLAGDLLLYAALLVQSRIMWFIGLKPHISYGWVLVPALIASAVAWVFEVLHAGIGISSNFVHYEYPVVSAWIIASLLVLIILPAGFFFLREGFKAGPGAHIRSSLKAISIGVAYLLVGGSSAYSYAAFYGSDTMVASTVNLMLFLTIIAVALVPAHQPHTEATQANTGRDFKDRIIKRQG